MSNTEALDTLNDYIDRLRDTCRECEHPICLQHIKSFKQYVDSECLRARRDELESNRNQTGYDVGSITMTNDDVEDRLKELNTGGNK